MARGGPDISRTRSNNALPRWCWLWLPPLPLLAIVGLAAADPARYRELFGRKEGPIEWVTVALLAIAVACGIRALLHRRHLPTRWLRGWVLLVTLGAFYFAGEELSWGQWIWHWETPEALAAVNRQQETNLHNISGWFNEKPRMLLELWVAVGGVGMALHLRRRRRRKGSPSRWFWPTIELVPVAVLALLTRVPDRIEKWVARLDLELFRELRLSEPQEMYFAWFLLLYLASMSRRLASYSEAPVTSPSMRLEPVRSAATLDS